MPIEYNMSHDETVSKWDETMDKSYSFLRQVFEINNLLNVFKKDVDKRNRFLLEIMQEKIHNIIDFQDGNNENFSKSDEEENVHEIINLSLLFLISQNHSIDENIEPLWINQRAINRKMMVQKNLEYGSSWSILRPNSIIDVIHTKIHRIMSLIEIGKTEFESYEDSYMDIINYCVFFIIRSNWDKG